jgi:hypothetical protein
MKGSRTEMLRMRDRSMVVRSTYAWTACTAGLLAATPRAHAQLELVASSIHVEAFAGIEAIDPSGVSRLLGTATDACESSAGCELAVTPEGYHCAEFSDCSPAPCVDSYAGCTLQLDGQTAAISAYIRQCGAPTFAFPLPTGELAYAFAAGRVEAEIRIRVAARCLLQFDFAAGEDGDVGRPLLHAPIPFRTLNPEDSGAVVPAFPGEIVLRISGDDSSDWNTLATSVRVTVVPAPDCDADFNGDGFVDFFDFDLFVLCFDGTAGAEPLADINGDGFIDFFDVNDFLDSFAAGC